MARPRIKLIRNIVVNHNRSFYSMIETDACDYVHPQITFESLPLADSSSGVRELSVALFHFNRIIKSGDVIAQMDKRGYRSGTIRELLALHERHPELIKKFPIVALKAALPFPYQVVFNYAVYLCYSKCKRCLSLCWTYSKWHASYRFLAIPK